MSDRNLGIILFLVGNGRRAKISQRSVLSPSALSINRCKWVYMICYEDKSRCIHKASAFLKAGRHHSYFHLGNKGHPWGPSCDHTPSSPYAKVEKTPPVLQTRLTAWSFSHSCFLSSSLVFLPWVHRPCLPVSLQKPSEDRLKPRSPNTGAGVSRKGVTATTTFNHKKVQDVREEWALQEWQNLTFLKVCMTPVHMTGSM